MKALVQKFMELFRGYENGHGEHELFDKPDEHGKLKGRAATKGTGATEAIYAAHLNGAGTSLGIIPLMRDNTCWFGAIDIDKTGETHLHEPIETLEARVRKLELPLVVCRSKSGGAHLYLFGNAPIPAKLMVTKLTEFSIMLGYGGCEIFPKQQTRVDERDLGNWINIAYYGALGKKGSDRLALKNGKTINKLEEFLKYVQLMRLSPAALQEVEIKLNEDFSDAPPCLQHLATFGMDQGGRNNGLVNIAVYFKKKHADEDWQGKVRQFNDHHVTPSLEGSEVQNILRNVANKDYFYSCKNPPICNHCDKKLCVTREYGIDGGDPLAELFPIDNLTKCIAKDSVRWYAEHGGHRLELTTDQLVSPVLLQKVFMEKFSVVIIIGKQRDWTVKLKELMDSVNEVHDPDDASRQGQFENILDNYLAASRPARNRDELILGNTYAEDGRVYFRSEQLFNYLTVRRFQHAPHEVWMWLKELDAKEDRFTIRGKKVRVWSIPEPERFEAGAISLPAEIEEEL